jgi:TonB-linked SusC/RagA family outer membrane protein
LKGTAKKRIILCAIIVLLSTAFSSACWSQVNGKRVTLRLQAVPIKVFFESVQNQTGLDFFYNADETKEISNVTISCRNELVENVLNRVIKRDGFSYKITGNIVIILKEDITITGRVVDSEGNPITALLVNVRGTRTVSYTDVNGQYSIRAARGATLTYSLVGYKMQSRKVGNREVINIVLEEAEETHLSDLVVVGYSKVERRDLTGSVSSVKPLDEKPYLSLDQMLAGQAPGVFVSNSSGELGSANLLTIRGVSSIMGDNNPLYVIDGVPVYGTGRSSNSSSTTGGYSSSINFTGSQTGGGSLNYNTDIINGVFEKNPLASINPDDIESIEILKDAYSTAIYGSRGSAGVILITTKKGSRERTQVNLSYTMSLDRPLGKLDLLNGDEYAMIYSAYYPGESFPTGKNTDWLDQVTRTAVSHSLSSSVSGGSEKSGFFLSLSYDDDQSYIINNGLKRYSARFNFDTKIGRLWTVGVNASVSRVNNKAVQANAIYGAALVKAPNLAVRDDDGEYHYGYLPNAKGNPSAYNPVAMAYINDESIRDTRTIGNVYLEFKPLSWLTLRSELGTDIYNSISSIRKGKLPSTETVPNNQAQETTSQNYKVVVNNTVNVNKMFGDHFFQGVVGQSYEYSNEYANAVAGSDFFSSDLVGVGAAKTKRVVAAGRQEWALFSLFARLNYQYKHRYMLGATYRVDGSSKFDKDNRYLGTPSISAGWRVSEESFMKSLKWIDELKIRGSVGWSSKDGNSSYYGAQAVYTLSSHSYGGSSYLNMSQPGNTDLDWEKTITYDAGLDLSLFGRRLDLTLDYFYKKTTNMLFYSNLPYYTGYTSQQQNIADMRNTGLEFRLASTNVRTKDLTWTSILNFSQYRNKILKLNFSGSQLSDLNSGTKYYQVGKPMAQFYLLDWAGVDPQTGNPLWKYADGSLSTTPPESNNTVSRTNRSAHGTAMPKVYGGLTNDIIYKDWELDFLFTFSWGGKVINSTKANLMTYSTSNANNLSTDILKMWQIKGQETDVPRLDNASIVGNYDYAAGIGSTRFLENNSYIRLKSLELAYNVPSKWLERTKVLGRLKLYVEMTNLFTITGYSGLDPEVSAFGSSAVYAGYDNMTMPQSRGFHFGIKASF